MVEQLRRIFEGRPVVLLDPLADPAQLQVRDQAQRRIAQREVRNDGEAPEDSAWVSMRVDSTGWMPVGDFVAFVRDEVPAHVRAELFVGADCVWRSDGEALR